MQGADEPAAGRAAPAPDEPEARWDAIRDRVVELVARMVAESPEPVVMGRAAHAAIHEAGPLITETRWLGKGTFKNLLLSVPGLPFQVVASPLPGYLFDPARHAAPADRGAGDGLAEAGEEMASLIRRIHQLTDAPKLTPRQYRVLFRVMAKELARAPYSLMSTGKAVRDQCVERGEPIARQSITNVLRGLGYAGYRFGEGEHRAEDLADAYRGNVLNLLRQAQVTLSDDELRMLHEWLTAAPSDPSAAGEPSADVQADAHLPEPDYAAWAQAILAQNAAAGDDPRPPSASTETPAPQPSEPAPETDVRGDGSGSADAVPAHVAPSAEAVEPEPWSWAPTAAPARDPWLADLIDGARGERPERGAYDPSARAGSEVPESAAEPVPDPTLAGGIAAEPRGEPGAGGDDVEREQADDSQSIAGEPADAPAAAPEPATQMDAFPSNTARDPARDAPADESPTERSPWWP